MYVDVVLAVATECVAWRQKALLLQYPGVQLFGDACEPEAFRVEMEVLIVSWPCMPYSAANRVPKGAIERFRLRARQNTELVVDVLRCAAAARTPPLLILLENVPGLVERSIYEECRALLLATLSGMPYVWRDGILCPAELRMGPQMRRRWFGVGVRADVLLGPECDG